VGSIPGLEEFFVGMQIELRQRCRHQRSSPTVLRRSQELQERVNKDDVARPRSVDPIDGAVTLEKEITSNAIFAGDIPLDMRHAYSASSRKDVFPKECSVGDDAVHLAHQSRLNGDDDLADLDLRLNIAVGHR
jgi:hypothetical protein